MPKVDVKVPRRSGFDKSFKNLLTSKCGTLTPILVDELIPNSRVNLRSIIAASLPPLASDTFMRCNLKVEAFFVPTRLLYGAFEDWLTKRPVYNPDSGEFDINTGLPYLQVTSNDVFTPGSLADYLGLRAGSVTGTAKFNIFPFLAYHRIYDDWYRNTLVQSPVFYRDSDSYGDGSVGTLPYSRFSSAMSFGLASSFPDGSTLGSLRQRNFGFDYFTGAMPNAQLGDAQKIEWTTPAVGSKGSFTIAALRAANSLQQFAERNQMAGLRYQDYIRANYGIDLSSGVAQRTILLGSGEIPVYSKGVYSQTTASPDGTTSVNNPFADSVGAQFGSAVCNGQLNLVDDFTAHECGYLMVLASLVPQVTYSAGVDRMLLRYNSNDSQTDMANPLLQNVGNQPIFEAELNGRVGGDSQLYVFGYTDRYADFKHKNDELHGLLRNGQSLQSFALQRFVTGSPRISAEFLRIPTDYLDGVAATDGAISNYGVWIDCYNSYRVSMPLAEYSIPSLQDPAYEHGNDVSIEVGGSRL